MAQIPLGNFGYAAPEIRRSQTVSTVVENNSGAMTAKIIGDAVSDVSSQFKANLELQSELESRKKRNKASTLRNEYETKLQTAELDLERQHAEGTIGSDALLPAWEQTAKKLKDELTPFADELDDETRAEFVSSLEGTRVNGLARFQGSALNAAKKDHQSSVTESYESFRKTNLGNAAAMDAWLAGEGGAEFTRAFGADAPEMIRKAKEQASLDSVTLAITNAGDDAGSLSRVHQQLQSKEAIARLDPDKWMAINSSLQGRIDSLNERASAKAERETLKREMGAQRSVEQTMEFITQGNVLSVEAISAVNEKTQGTSQHGIATNLLKYQDSIKRVLDSPAKERTAYLESQRRRIAEEGSTPEQLAQFKMLENAAKQRDEMEKSDPHLAYEVKTGSDRIAVDPDSDTMNVAIAEREARAKQAGTPDLLRPDERKDIAGRITVGAPDKRLAEIEKITSKLSPQQAVKIMAEAGAEKDAGYSAYAGMMVAKGKKGEALAILKGDEILKAGAEGYESKSAFTDNLPKEFNEAFKHDELARKNAIEVAYRNYLAWVTPGTDAKSSLADDAALSVESVIGKTAKVGRTSVLMPDGYDADQFESVLQSSFAKTKETLQIQGDVDDYQYRPITDSRTGKTVYRIDVDGKPLGSAPIYLSVD